MSHAHQRCADVLNSFLSNVHLPPPLILGHNLAEDSSNCILCVHLQYHRHAGFHYTKVCDILCERERGLRKRVWYVIPVGSHMLKTTCGQQLCEDISHSVTHGGTGSSLAHVWKAFDCQTANLHGKKAETGCYSTITALRIFNSPLPHMLSAVQRLEVFVQNDLLPTVFTCASSSSMRSNMASMAFSARAGKCWKNRVINPAASFFSPSEPLAALMIPS